MQIEKYLRETQPVIYKTFVSALKENKLSHAYLLVGNPGTPLLETAKFLAKSIVCDSPDPLACNNCLTCMRFDDDNYTDLVVIDGAKDIIKKDQIEEIQNRFGKSSTETSGKMIYILNLVENTRIETINSLLKFLEEPKPNVHAFLTTNNENAILPTIISRCQTLHLKLIDRKKVIVGAENLGIDKDDAEVLSYFYNDSQLLKSMFDDKTINERYMTCKDAVRGLLEALNEDKNSAIFYVESKLTTTIKDKETLRFFLDFLAQIFEDLLNLQNHRDIILTTYDTILHKLSLKLPHIESSLLEILKTRNLIYLNLNSGLQLDHLILSIVKE